LQTRIRIAKGWKDISHYSWSLFAPVLNNGALWSAGAHTLLPVDVTKERSLIVTSLAAHELNNKSVSNHVYAASMADH